MQHLNVESGKLEKNIDDHLKKDYPDSFIEKGLQIHKKQLRLTMELEQRRQKNRKV